MRRPQGAPSHLHGTSQVRTSMTDTLSREIAIDLAFQADCIDAGLVDITRNAFAGAARKPDHFDPWMARA